MCLLPGKSIAEKVLRSHASLGFPRSPLGGGSGREAESSWVIRQRPRRKVSKQRGHISKLRRALESRCVTALGKRQEEARKAT